MQEPTDKVKPAAPLLGVVRRSGLSVSAPVGVGGRRELADLQRADSRLRLLVELNIPGLRTR